MGVIDLHLTPVELANDGLWVGGDRRYNKPTGL